MIISYVAPGSNVRVGTTIAKFIHISGPDALVELRNGSRVVWASTTEVEIVAANATVEAKDRLPALRVELARLESFSEGKYAPLGVSVTTPCTLLPLELHRVFITAALGPQPDDAIVCRRCPEGLCVNAGHLFWGTRSDCQRDMVLRGVARPRGKQVSVVAIAARIVKLRLKIATLEGRI